MTSNSCIPNALANAFYKYGKFLGRNPLPFLLLPLIITGLFIIGIFTSFELESDPQYLYVPVGSRSLKEREFFDSHFVDDDKTRFSPIRLTFPEGFLQILISEATEANVLNDDILQAISELDEMILSFELRFGGKSYNYSDLCAKWSGSCSSNGLLSIYRENNNSLENVTLTYPVHKGLTDVNVLTRHVGSVKTDESGRIISLGSIGLIYSVQTGDDVIEISNEWLDAIRDQLLEYNDPRIEIEFRTANSVSQELERSLRSLYSVSVICLVVLSTFSIVSCLMFDPVRSKPWVACSGLVAACLAIVSSTGLMSAAGVKFASIVGTMPFLIIGK